MTIYIVALALLMILGTLYDFNQNAKSKKVYVFIVFALLIVISMLRSYTVGRDLNGHYYKTFYKVADTNWADLSTIGYERGYVIFYKIISLFTNNAQWMIAIHSIFVMGVTGWFIYKNSEDVVLSTFLFVATNTWFMYMNIMRQTMAVCIVLIAYDVIYKRKLGWIRYFLFLLLIILATQFHSTALLSILFVVAKYLPFKRNQIVLSGALLVGAIVFYDKIFNLISLLKIGKRDYTEFYADSASAINITSIYFVLLYATLFAVSVLCLVYYHYGSRKIVNQNINGYSDNFLLYMALGLLICRITGLRISIMTRMSFYFLPFLFILVPRALQHMEVAFNRKILKYGLYVVMFMAFVVLGYRNAAVLYGTVPYKFFWQ